METIFRDIPNEFIIKDKQDIMPYAYKPYSDT